MAVDLYGADIATPEVVFDLFDKAFCDSED
jgi:hypothetical protein